MAQCNAVPPRAITCQSSGSPPAPAHLHVEAQQMMFAELPLHDATLLVIHFAWAEGRCTLHLATVDLGERALVFTDVTEVHIPKEQPWGPSASINAAREAGPNRFEVELQSGDVLRVQAAGWAFGPVGAA